MTVTEQEISSYAEAVRRALADLPPDVRDELPEDLPEHLPRSPPRPRARSPTGSAAPEAYATELRVAAGVRAAPPMGRNLDDQIAAAVRVARSRMGVVDLRAGPVLGYEKASDFLASAPPGLVGPARLPAGDADHGLTTSEFYLMPELAAAWSRGS